MHSLGLSLGPRGTVREWRYSLDYTLADPGQPHAVPVDRLSLVDSLDVGYRASEKPHGYQASYASWEPATESRLTEGSAVRDQGRQMPLPAWEEFNLASRTARPLTLVVRHEAIASTYAKVFIDGQYVSDWLWPKGRYILSESLLEIPPQYIRSSSIHVRIEFDRREDSVVAAPSHYWAYVPGWVFLYEASDSS